MGIQSDGVEHALDIQIHDLGKGLIRMGVEFLSPCSSGVGKQYVNMICCFGDFVDKMLNPGELRAIGGD
jgi:hypothetical protein